MKLPLKLILSLATAGAFLATAAGKPTENQAPGVEIQKQRLIRFPDDFDSLQLESNQTAKNEAERILHEIAKINEAFGYVKKQSNAAIRPVILDSAQYLYPNPNPYHPFLAHNEHSSDDSREALLLPSIRSVNYERSSGEQLQKQQLIKEEKTLSASGIATTPTIKTKHQPEKHKQEKIVAKRPQDIKSNINEPKEEEKMAQDPTVSPPKQVKPKTPQNYHQQETRPKERPHDKLKNGTKSDTKQKETQRGSELQLQGQYSDTPPFHFHPQGTVYMPPPQALGESPELLTHFALPVRLYKLDKEEYLRNQAPQEYPLKGYKIVGDINNFYGQAQAKSKSKNKTKTKSKVKSSPTSKYHLFLLPRDMALSAEAASKEDTEKMVQKSSDKSQESGSGSSSREEKLATHRPFKIQASATTTNNNGMTNSSTTMQIIRKRIIPRPFGGGPAEKETNVESQSGTLQQQRPGGPLAATLSSIRITPPPISMQGNTYASQVQNQGGQGNGGSNQPLLNNNNNNNNNFGNNFYRNNTNAIKTAFQNFFKFPFRQPPPQQPAPAVVAETPVMLQAVPLQQPMNPFYAGQSVLPQPFYIPSGQQGGGSDDDYRWEDEDVSNSAAEEEDSTEPQEEKHIFGFGHKQHQMQLQKEALRQGGIIIQRLKVRKGGIAIAGPGGVATAGSGGTAIVGPGGYALTHPRSLTIAGPGAKVIAIPADVDLQDALDRTDLSIMSFPREGKIVATGPTVYYAPGTAAAIEI